MPNALADLQPAPQGNAFLGSGLAEGAADLKRLHPLWQQQFIDGLTDLQFTDWLAQQGIKSPVMPRG